MDLGTNHLSVEDETRIADDFAFLAHWDEGAYFVSAVTLQEQSEGLEIVIASNETPRKIVLDELRQVASILMDYASSSELIFVLWGCQGY
jgi:hypothetical protein